MYQKTGFKWGLIFVFLSGAIPLAADVVWDFEGGNDHGFVLWSARPAASVPDDPDTAGDEALTGKALPEAGVAWTIGRPDQWDGQKPPVAEGDKTKADGTMEYNQAGTNHPFTFPVNGRGQESYLNTYDLTGWGDNVHTETNDQVATSPMVLLSDGARLSVWAHGGGSGTHAPELEASPGEAYTSGSAGVAVRSAIDDSLLESVYTNGQGTLREDTIDLSAYAGQMVYIEAVDAFQGSWGWLAIDEIAITHAVELIDRSTARNPNPVDGASDIPHDVVLSWMPGEYAPATDGHRVFLGEQFADVNDGLGSVDRGTVSEPAFDTATLATPLAFNTTYYWRVDEANDVKGWDEGPVWSFTVEPVSYPVPIGAVGANGSSTDGDGDPIKTVNGVGLNENDEHSAALEDMWSSASTDMNPWIQFEFAKAEKLDRVHIWNHNTQTESILGFGIKEALIETSVDGETWSELGTVELAQAPGKANYTGEDIALNGVVSKVVKITGLSNYSLLGLPQRGLAEVRFYAVPMRARLEIPEVGATDVDPLVDLSWRAGREAGQHEVLIGTDPEALVLAGTVEDPSFTAAVDLDSTVYWQVNEINNAMDPAVWEGSIWSFDTAAYVTVDNMEAYKSSDGSWVWETWTDGFGDDNNGALLGHNGDDMEKDIAYDGGQSLPYYYGQGGAGNSEAVRGIDRDWSAHGIVSLSLMFHGATGNIPGQMYIKVNGERVATHPTPADLKLAQWQAWTVDLPVSALGRVDTLAIGIEGGTGHIFIDAIRLYARPSEVVTPVTPADSGLMAYYPLNDNTLDMSGNGHDGVAVGGPLHVTGPAGMGSGLKFDGSGDQYVTLGTWNPSAANGQLTLSLWTQWNGTSGYYQGLIGKRDSWAADGMMWDLEANIDTGVVRFGRNGSTVNSGMAPTEMGEWEPWAVTADGTMATIYRYGIPVVRGAFSFGTKADANLQLGSGAMEGENPYNGTLSEVYLYDRVLEPGEVAGLAGRTSPYYKPFD